MLRRCDNETQDSYIVYGARGIKVSQDWATFIGFKNDMYESYMTHAKIHGEKNTSIDRIDNNEGYLKENCRWVTWKKQQRNRRNNRLIDFDGVTHSLAEWAEIKCMTYSTLKFRLKRGWEIGRALTEGRKINQFV